MIEISAENSKNSKNIENIESSKNIKNILSLKNIHSIKIFLFLIIIVMSCLISSSFTISFIARSYAENQYNMIEKLAQAMISNYPGDEQEIVGLIKYSSASPQNDEIVTQSILSGYGYKPESFAPGYKETALLIAAGCLLIFLLLLMVLIQSLKKSIRFRIGDLTAYLEKINTNQDVTILPPVEDDFSPLQDEIYKTVTSLNQTTDAAVDARKNYADNLANIAHQIKTPLTAVLVITELLEGEWKPEYPMQIKNQTMRLNQLSEALLTLSRIDAGVLKLEKKQVDVYTMLQIAVDTVYEMTSESTIKISLLNHSEIMFIGDLEWSVEAMINVIKNCMEHTQDSGEILIEYVENPLYVEITIKDSGEGFEQADLPHIFERFYRGKSASKTGIGIGLSLSKSLIEMQNGFITAQNLPDGGAGFSIRFYSRSANTFLATDTAFKTLGNPV